MLTKAIWAGIVLSAGLLLSGASTAKADCRDRVRHEERDLARAERRFGPWSRQASEERNEFFRARQSCGNRGNGWLRGDGWLGRDGGRGLDRDDHRHRRDRDHDRDDRGRRRDRDRDRDRD